jgi:nucleoside-diphosphate-sugar epimerase
MKVFVSGATGYVGLNVARALRREGHQVWGMTRFENKKDLLLKSEIIPVVGDMRKADSYKKYLPQMEILVHAALAREKDAPLLDKETVKIFMEACNRSNTIKMFVYTSGVWVIGDTGDSKAQEDRAPKPIKMVAWRVEVEKMVLKGERVNTIVIRPGCVYGKQGGLTGLWFGSAENDKVFSMVGSGNNRWAMVHVDDLADAYVRAALTGYSREIFNIADSSHVTIGEIAQAIARVTGYNDRIKFKAPDDARREIGDLADGLAIDQQVDSIKARSILGWNPRHHGFTQDVTVYYKAWKSFQNEQR